MTEHVQPDEGNVEHRQEVSASNVLTTRHNDLLLAVPDSIEEVQDKLHELQNIVEAASTLAQHLKEIDCGLHITLGKSQDATFLAAMLGLCKDRGKQQTSLVVRDEAQVLRVVEASEESVASEIEDDPRKLPFVMHPCLMPSLVLAAIHKGETPLWEHKIDPKAFYAGFLDRKGRRHRYAVSEVLVRLFLGNPGEMFEICDLLEIMRDLGFPVVMGKSKGVVGAVTRSVIAHNLRKLRKCGFVRLVAPVEGHFGSLYRINQNYNPRESYLKKIFFGRIRPIFFNDREKKPGRMDYPM